MKVTSKAFSFSFFLFVVGGVLFANSAMASVATLYSGDIGNCQAPGLTNLFSGFVCTYQQVVDQILTQLYTAMVVFFERPFFAALTLFVITVGIMFGMGLIPFTTKDIMIALAKIALLTGFAMYPSLMINLVYDGLIGFMRQSVDTVVQVIAPQGSVSGIFTWMDLKFYEFLALQDTAQTNKNCNNDILALLFGLAITMPPVFAIAIYVLFQLVMVFVRTVLGYLISITGIMFLTTLAPLFFGFALFSFTRSYFDKWVAYMLGFTVQIFVVFSFIAVVLSLPFESKLEAVMDTVRPYERVAFHDGQRMDFNRWCTLCASSALGASNTPDGCTGGAISPTNVQAGGNGDIINWVGQELIILAVMAYLVETILKAAPDVAKYLTQVAYAPALGGKSPFPTSLNNAGTAAFRAFRDTKTGAIGGVQDAARAATGQLLKR
jgi:TrbL/VirB6 plasmid conjugal transfer protein